GLVAAHATERELSTELICQPAAEEKEPAAKEAPPEVAKQAAPPETKTETSVKEPPVAPRAAEKKTQETGASAEERLPVPLWLWIAIASGVVIVAVIYWLWSWERLEVFKMLLVSFFP